MVAAPTPGLAVARAVFALLSLTATIAWRISGVDAGTPAMAIGTPLKLNSINADVAETGRFDVSVAKPLLNGRGPLAPVCGDWNIFVWPPASWNVFPTGCPFSSTSARFNGEPLSSVRVIVPLAAGVPSAAGFVTTITLIQPTPAVSWTPSTNCGKYKTVCAEQIPAANKSKTRLKTM